MVCVLKIHFRIQTHFHKMMIKIDIRISALAHIIAHCIERGVVTAHQNRRTEEKGIQVLLVAVVQQRLQRRLLPLCQSFPGVCLHRGIQKGLIIFVRGKTLVVVSLSPDERLPIDWIG